MSTDPLADLQEARLAVRAAERELAKLGPTDAARLMTQATLERARKRYAQAVKAQQESVAARRPWKPRES
jgi:hypothetical protein